MTETKKKYRTQEQFNTICESLINGNFTQACEQCISGRFFARDLRLFQAAEENNFDCAKFYQVIETITETRAKKE